METANIPNALTDFGSVMDWVVFTTADEKYRALVAVTEQEGWGRLIDRIYLGAPDSDVSEVESVVFGIEAAEILALYWAYERYLNLIGSSQMYYPFTAQERITYARFFSGSHQWAFNKAAGFMASACGLPLPKCMAWVCKVVASQVRNGIYDDETEE